MFKNIYQKAGDIYLTLLLLLLLLIGLSGNCQPDTLVTLPGGEMSYKVFIDSIAHQTGLGLHFDDRSKVRLNICMPKGVFPLHRILKYSLQRLHMSYYIDGKIIWTRPDPAWEKEPQEPIITFLLKVTGNNEVLAYASIRTEEGMLYLAGKDGVVIISACRAPVVLTITHVGYRAVTLIINESKDIEVQMKREDKYLDEIVVRGYFAESRRISTGGWTSMDVQLLDRHFSGGSLSSFLPGRVAGLLSTQTSGVAGASFKISLRSRMSILNGRDLLYVIDGIPYGPGNQSLSNNPAGNSAGSLDPLSLLPVDDIESINVLKDADATSMYGARGANGVMLITTQRAMPGKCRLDITAGTGYSRVTTRPSLLNMHEYAAMRRESIRNDNLPMDAIHAPELILWDTTRHKDWSKWAIGGLGYKTNVHLSLSGGSKTNSYYAGLSGLREINVFVTHPAHLLLTMDGKYSHHSKDGRFNTRLTGMLSRNKNEQLTEDVTRAQFLAPNSPGPWGKDGKPIFQTDVPFTNPVYYTESKYVATSRLLLMGGAINYKLFDSLMVRMNGGFNDVLTKEHSIHPISSQDPALNPRGSSYWASTQYSSWIVEPQIEYTVKKRRWAFSGLAGAGWQGLRTSVHTISASGFTDDAFLPYPELTDPDSVSRQNPVTDYRYTSYFGRLNVNWKNTYILNFTDRWDGSSRYIGSKHFGNFWAMGAAWVFSEENFCRKYLSFVSYGKLRASYGTTGNDQIGGGSRYLDTWAPASAVTFQNVPGTISPGQLNPAISWERVQKTEIALDAGFRDSWWLLTVAWYRHHSDHQLLPDRLPMTGDLLRLRNVPVELESHGWEFSILSRNIDNRRFGWTTSLNLSFPSSRLVTLGGFAGVPFNKELVPGKPLGTLRAFHYLGINPLTGLYQVEDRNGDNKYNSADMIVAGSPDVTCFGGIENILRWTQWELAVQLEGRIQKGVRYRAAILYANAPGTIGSGVYSNQLKGIADRWRMPGDNGDYQILSSGNDAAMALSRYLSSDGILTDASFVRVKTISLSYEWPVARHKVHIRGMKMTLQAQNLFTLTSYRDGDPEIQSAVILPPLRTIVAGLQVKF